MTRAHAIAEFNDDGSLLGLCGDDSGDQIVAIGRIGARNKASIISDSRSADALINPYATNGRNWFIQACAYYKAAIELHKCYGVSGKRTDEYLTNGNLELAIADSAGVLIFGYPVVNDLSQASTGYTDTFGRAVTASNAVDYVIGNLVAAINKARLSGKQVVVVAEPGSSTMNPTSVAMVHEFNRKYRAAVQDIPGVIYYSANHLLWDASGANNAIALRANFSSDGTHYQQMAARIVGKDFAAKVLPLLTPQIDTAVASPSAIIGSGVGQLFANPLLTALTGGSSSNVTVSSGNVPSGVSLTGSAAGILSAAITSAPNADGLGNDVTFSLTATAAVTARIDFIVPSASVWELTDVVQAGVEYDLAAGSNASVFLAAQLNDNTGTRDCYANYTGSSGPAAGLAESGVVLRTLKNTWNPAATVKGYLNSRLSVQFPAAGTATVTIRRPFIDRYR